MIEDIGWIGSILLAICGLPQAFLSWKQGHSRGVSWFFLILWLLGEVFTLIYVIAIKSTPLLINYTFNIAFISVILYYKIWTRDSEIELRSLLESLPGVGSLIKWLKRQRK